MSLRYYYDIITFVIYYVIYLLEAEEALGEVAVDEVVVLLLRTCPLRLTRLVVFVVTEALPAAALRDVAEVAEELAEEAVAVLLREEVAAAV